MKEKYDDFLTILTTEQRLIIAEFLEKFIKPQAETYRCHDGLSTYIAVHICHIQNHINKLRR